MGLRSRTTLALAAGIRTAGSLRQRAGRWVVDHPTGRWVLFGSVVGLLCGAAASIFEICTDLVARALLEELCGLPSALAASHPAGLSLEGDFSPILLVAVMAGGGLLAGLIAFRWSSAARGGGTGVAVQAFHQDRGRIPLSVPWAKLAASIASLGSGGSGGREGPISLIGAGFGSWFATRMRLSAQDRRILLAAGIAGGIAAVFRAPLAAAIFAAEVLYRGPDLESDVLIPAFIAAAIAYLGSSLGTDLLGPLVGHAGIQASTLFQPPPVSFRVGDWMQLAGYSGVALAAAAMSRWFIALNRQAGERFACLRLPVWARPGAGALLAGVVAIGVLAIATLLLGAEDRARLTLGTVGGGYGTLHRLFFGLEADRHHLELAGLLALIALGKSVTTAFTVGSGGSAGLFGPSIVIGGCTGGAIGFALQGLPIGPPPAACILMGMAGTLAATHRTPVAAVLMASEIAGTWRLLLPAMWVSGLAFLLVGRRSLVGGQVDGLEDSPAHRSHLFSDLLGQARIRDLPALVGREAFIPAGSSLAACLALMQHRQFDRFPVLGTDGRITGMVSRIEVVRAAAAPLLQGMVLVDDLVDGEAETLREDDSLATAMHRLQQQRVEALPVVDAEGRFRGLATSILLLEHYQQAVERARSDEAPSRD